MINLDEDALICDFAETYHIYDYRSLPVCLAATFAAGLRDSSRIKLLAAGAPARQEILLLASIADRIEAFRYGFSDDAASGINRPVSIVSALFGESTEKKQNGKISFSTPEEFEAALARIKGTE